MYYYSFIINWTLLFIITYLCLYDCSICPAFRDYPALNPARNNWGKIADKPTRFSLESSSSPYSDHHWLSSSLRPSAASSVCWSFSTKAADHAATLRDRSACPGFWRRCSIWVPFPMTWNATSSPSAENYESRKIINRILKFGNNIKTI